MGDALCGPSNPLQNLRKQTAADRTLQQDRIIARQAPPDSIRSPAGPRAGILNPEFEAFQAGQEQLPFHSPAQTFSQSSNLPEWAADFQRLHLSSPPPPLHAQHLLQHDQQIAPAGPSSWHQDFLQQTPHTQSANSSQQSPSYPTLSQFGSHFGGVATFSTLHEHVSTQEQRNPRETYDDAAFARAFDSLQENTMEDQAQQGSSNHLAAQAEAELLRDAEETRNAAAELHGRFEARRMMQEAGIPMNDDGLPTFEEIQEPLSLNEESAQRPDDHLEQKQEAQQQARDDADELAATAGQLLDSVADNQSAKFGNSKFLELMRKLRDREVWVEGDKMVDVNEVSQLSNYTGSTIAVNKAWDQQQDKILSMDLEGTKHGRSVLFDDFVACFGVPPSSDERYIKGIAPPAT